MQRSQPIAAAKMSAYRIIFIQLMIICLLTLTGGILLTSNTALSLLLGGLGCLLPQMYFARRFFSQMDTRNARDIVHRFYWGEVIKLLLTVALMLVFVLYTPVNLGFLALGFIAAQLGVWLAPLFETRQAAKV